MKFENEKNLLWFLINCHRKNQWNQNVNSLIHSFIDLTNYVFIDLLLIQKFNQKKKNGIQNWIKSLIRNKRIFIYDDHFYFYLVHNPYWIFVQIY